MRLFRPSDWRVQVLDENGRWHDVHAGTRAGPAIREYAQLNIDNKRLLRNGKPLRMSDPEQLPL